jgi:SAM-dependent methyltransferase
MANDVISRIWRQVFRVTRKRRMKAFSKWAKLTEATTVLDVGGTEDVWAFVPVMPRVTLLNVTPSQTSLHQIVGDGSHLPFIDNAFDIVFSNSVIEHVPDHESFAKEIQRVGRRYFVQTPNSAFPFEPHVLTPLVNYLPKRWQKKVFRNFTIWGLLSRPDQLYVNNMVDEISLLNPVEMKRLFPDGSVWSGRSLIARM